MRSQLNPKSNVVTKSQIIEDLRKIGIVKGDVVAVTLSLKSIGFVDGGADAFIDALLEAIGPQGTVMMNTFTYNFPLSKIQSNYIFDPATSEPWTGIVPSKLLKRAGATRSLHPVNSIVAIGKYATFLTEEHNEKAKPYLPYAKLAEINGKYLCIGLGNNLVAIRHEAQYQADIPRFLPYGVKYKNQKGQTKVFVWEHPPCEKNLPALVPKIDKLGIIKHGKIGNASSQLMSAKEFIANEANLLRNDPTLNQCGDMLCLQCRELERKSELWKAIVNPKFFQRSFVARHLLRIRNHLLILERHRRLTITDKNTNRGLDKIIDLGSRLTAKILTRIIY